MRKRSWKEENPVTELEGITMEQGKKRTISKRQDKSSLPEKNPGPSEHLPSSFSLGTLKTQRFISVHTHAHVQAHMK